MQKNDWTCIVFGASKPCGHQVHTLIGMFPGDLLGIPRVENTQLPAEASRSQQPE